MDKPSDNNELLCEGLGASSGCATGPAKVIKIDRPEKNSDSTLVEMSGFEQISTGDIMITPEFYTDMITAVEQISGLVVYNEHGVTGRGSVTARASDIPAVVACSESIATIDVGKDIKINGQTGRIYEVRHK